MLWFYFQATTPAAPVTAVASESSVYQAVDDDDDEATRAPPSTFSFVRGQSTKTMDPVVQADIQQSVYETFSS